MLKKYKIIYQDKGRKEKILESEDLSSLDLPANTISVKEEKARFFIFSSKIKIKEKKFLNILRELNIMIQGDISLIRALEILINKEKDRNIKLFLLDISYGFSNASSLQILNNKYKINSEILAFLSLAQNSGNIKLYIKSLYELLKQNNEIKKSFIKALSYPLLLLVTLIISFLMIFTFVIPKFILIFQGDMQNASFLTKSLLYFLYLFENYILYFVFFMLMVFVSFIYLYLKNEKLVYFFHSLFIKYAFIYKNMYMYKLFLVLEIMLKSKHEFHKALEFSKVLINNKRLLDKMSIINSLLLNGRGIKDSFEKTELFDETVLSLIYSAELSNSLEKSFKEIKNIYKDRFEEEIRVLIFTIEPVFILIIVLFILWIVLAIFVPLWDMGNFMKF